MAFIRMAGGVACVEDREDAHVDFTRTPVTPRVEEREARRPLGWKVRAGLAAAVLVLGCVVLWPHLQGPREREAGTTCPPPIESISFTDSQVSPPSLFGYPMPKAPFEGQMKPPCGEGSYVEVKGGCWAQLKQDAPCAKDAAEDGGKCYVPVREKQPVPRSIRH